MDITIFPGKLNGTLTAIPSKSHAHRLLICAAFSDGETVLYCPETNQDIDATAQCLCSLGAHIERTVDGYIVKPVSKVPASATLNCSESGSTLRFMLPIAGALGVDAVFQMRGRLPQRPLSPLWEEMERMGCHLSRPTADTIRCTGRLKCGQYEIDGSVSSQFITGLLFAMALIPGKSNLMITGKIESKPYIQMTRQALNMFGVSTTENHVIGSIPFSTPNRIVVEGDWSNAAFFLAANALGSNVTISGLNPDSAQGDKAVTVALSALKQNCTISAGDIPDLVPILSVVAGSRYGAIFTDVGRLRLKESDRVESVAAMLRNLGATVDIVGDTLKIHASQYHGCTIDSARDHRIAMAAAIAVTTADGPVTILGAECVSKSYPTFWQEFQKLGGNYEQHIR